MSTLSVCPELSSVPLNCLKFAPSQGSRMDFWRINFKVNTSEISTAHISNGISQVLNTFLCTKIHAFTGLIIFPHKLSARSLDLLLHERHMSEVVVLLHLITKFIEGVSHLGPHMNIILMMTFPLSQLLSNETM